MRPYEKGFTFGENVATQQRTFRHEKSKIFRATFLRRKARPIHNTLLFYLTLRSSGSWQLATDS
jgi:hypothetical protein